jgi:uncharacterized protein (DUF305 family)
VVLALAVGLAVGILVSSGGKPGDGSAEAGFARDMTTHHNQAIKMAMLAYTRVDDSELRGVAEDIALQQEIEVGTMSAWLTEWNLTATGDKPAMSWMPDGAAAEIKNGLMPGMATEAQINQLQAATGHDADVLFCQLMLRHHLGGIHMIDGILQVSKNKTVTDLATNMKSAQQSEVNLFQRKLSELHAQPLPA